MWQYAAAQFDPEIAPHKRVIACLDALWRKLMPWNFALGDNRRHEVMMAGTGYAVAAQAAGGRNRPQAARPAAGRVERPPLLHKSSIRQC
jgi:hypothetical protein